MESCPACCQQRIAAWRRIFYSFERFKCPSCGVWIRFREPARPPPALLKRLKNADLRALVVGLAPAALLLGVTTALIYLVRYFPWLFNRWILFVFLGLVVVEIARSDFKRRNRLLLEIAPSQEMHPSLDGIRIFKAAIGSQDGRRTIRTFCIFILTLSVTLGLTSILLKHLPTVLPGLPKPAATSHTPRGKAT